MKISLEIVLYKLFNPFNSEFSFSKCFQISVYNIADELRDFVQLDWVVFINKMFARRLSVHAKLGVLRQQQLC